MDARVIAKRLIELRGDKTRETVARAVDISVSALTMYENAARIPRDEIKIRLAEYYHTTVDALFFASKCHDK